MSAEDRWLEAWQQRDRLLRIARRRVPTREDAEDVVAEAIQRAGAQTDLPVSAVPAWVTRVTINLCVDRQRRLATQRAALHRAELRPEVLPTHEDAVVARAEAAWLTGKIEELPLRQALAVRLRADGISNAEIATLLEVTQASVDGLLKRSRAALRGALQAAGAVIAAAWAAVFHSRKTAVVLVAAASVLMVLLPWTGDPGAPGSTLPAAPGMVALPPSTASVSSAATAGAVVSGPRVEVAGRGAPAVRPEQIPEGLGRAVPYNGPRCLAKYCLPVVDDQTDKALGATSPRGWSPADLHDYLGEPSLSASAAARRPLVAIVGWYDFPWLVDDLAHYRRTFRLPPCGRDDGCLRVEKASAENRMQDEVLSTGLAPAQNAAARTTGIGFYGSAGAQAQMLQGVSATCPECRLALVVADTDSVPDLVEAFRMAQSMSPEVVVTNLSFWEGTEGSVAPLEDPRLYNGALVIAGAGFGGFTPGQGGVPNRFPNVVTAGSTAVHAGRVVGASENGSFCNRTTAPPAWQAASDTGCVGRAGVDLVLPADVATSGLSTYISGGLLGGRGWYHPGRSTQAAAIFGGLLARHNLAGVIRGPGDLYAHPEWFADITAGSTDCLSGGCTNDTENPGQTCRPSERQLCQARRGWDGLTGLGEPRYLPWR